MKSLEGITNTLIIIGALRRGCVGNFDSDAVAALSGHSSGPGRIVYATVSVATLYEVLSVRSIARRWDMRRRSCPVPAYA